MNTRQWRKKGAKTIIRNGVIYLAFLDKKKVYCAPIDKGNWMNYEDLAQDPWVDVSEQVYDSNNISVQILALDIIASIHQCYCDNSVDICDYCAGIRPVTDTSLNHSVDPEKYLAFFSEPNTRYAVKRVESDTSQLEFNQEHGTMLNPGLPKDYEYRVFEYSHLDGYLGLSGQFGNVEDIENTYGVKLDKLKQRPTSM